MRNISKSGIWDKLFFNNKNNFCKISICHSIFNLPCFHIQPSISLKSELNSSSEEFRTSALVQLGAADADVDVLSLSQLSQQFLVNLELGEGRFKALTMELQLDCGPN